MYSFFQDLAFVDTLVNLTGVAIECLDFSTPGLFAMATTVGGKSPNTTPTKWNKRLQRPMGNFTSVVNVAVKLLSACERTSNSKVTLSTCHIILCSFFAKLLPPGLCTYEEVPVSIAVINIRNTASIMLITFIMLNYNRSRPRP